MNGLGTKYSLFSRIYFFSGFLNFWIFSENISIVGFPKSTSKHLMFQPSTSNPTGGRRVARGRFQNYFAENPPKLLALLNNWGIRLTGMGLNASESSHLLYVSDALYSNTCSMYAMEEIMQGLRLRFL